MVAYEEVLPGSPALDAPKEDWLDYLRDARGKQSEHAWMREFCLVVQTREGAVYDLFDRNRHVTDEDLGDARLWFNGLDWGSGNPAGFLQFAVAGDGTLVVVDEEKYPVGGAGEGRCRLHGGASTGPDEPATEHLEGNDHAVDNDGGAPEGNANARIHGGFSDWRKAYDRFDEDTREMIDDVEEWRQNNLPEQYLNGNDIDN